MINIIFVKVAAHTGVQYNELADQLAKMQFHQGLLKQITKMVVYQFEALKKMNSKLLLVL